ncbi:MAG: 4Fe-4S dicluster domain-containing protein [Candidatus Thermoplasmatota archaeon]
MKYLFAYPEKCTGCRECAIACSLKKFGECNPKKAAINIVRDEFGRYEIQFLCLQCDEPVCVAVCMTNALKKEGNVVKWDKEKCIGCRMCVVSCPYAGVASFNGELLKCDLCGGDPTCVKFCSTKAIVYEEESKEILERRKKLAELFRK